MELTPSLEEYPSSMSVLLFVALLTFLAMIAPVIVRRRFGIERLLVNNEVAGHYFAVVGTIYAVLLAFATIATWEKFNDAENATAQEIGALSALYRMSGGLGDEARDLVRSRLATYITTVVHDEWPAMARGSFSVSAHSALTDLYAAYANYNPGTERESVILSASFDQLDHITQERYERLVLARGIIPGVLWVVLVSGAVLTTGFTLFFGSKSLWAQSLMTGLLSALIMLTLLVAVSLNFPFTGSVRVSSDAFSVINDVGVRQQ